jgi:hypothetical protein
MKPCLGQPKHERKYQIDEILFKKSLCCGAWCVKNVHPNFFVTRDPLLYCRFEVNSFSTTVESFKLRIGVLE